LYYTGVLSFMVTRYTSYLRDYVGFEVLTEIIMKGSVFWDIAPCGPVQVENSFRGTSLACCLLHAYFLPGLLFDPEDVGDILLRNVG
jgi:hypothetical protein